MVPDVSQLQRVLTETVARQRSGIISADKLPPECRSVTRRKLTQMEALERDAIVRSLQDNGGNKQDGGTRPGNVTGHHLPQDKRLRHRVTPLGVSAQKHWLTIIVATPGIPRHLLPHAPGS